MKKYCYIFIFVLMLVNSLWSQDSVNVTFRHYPTTATVVRAFVPGTFNNWGPNSSGFIAPTAPSIMTYVDSLGFYVKTIKLRVGDTHNYKFHEHYNSSGSQWQWFTDPLNPLINYSDNNNSILHVEKTMIFELLPQKDAVLTNLTPTIVAGVFAAENDSLLLNQSTIYLDDALLTTFEGNVIEGLSILSYELPVLNSGNHSVIINLATHNGESTSDTLSFTVQTTPPIIEELPEGIIDGVNYIDESTVTLALYAPHKQFAYIIGDFNDWQIDSGYYMKMTPDSSRFWLTITNLQPAKEYVFQYLFDGKIRIADPYTDKIIDPWNDSWITNATYPDLISYPDGKTSEIAAVLQTAQDSYIWEATDFQRPAQKDLVIYEMLIRDFIAEHDYKTLTDTLSYFEKLGVSAIEIMPFNEFEGNESWGYNPAFYFAPDKYYGPKNDLKKFIDEAHKRGIAIIMDIVLNHAYGQCPLVRLYSDAMNENPWFNETSPNPVYFWGYDFNHESEVTQAFVDRVTSYWIQEYKIDGFRFDFSKGFTNKSGDGWAKDNSRIAILKRMADQIWAVDSTVYVILEHFAENSEEIILSNYGMMLWGNMNTAYSQSAMGWLNDSQQSSDLSWGFYKNRSWTKPHLVTYMESHDEPYIMYKNIRWGRSLYAYDIRETATGLNRIKLISTFFYLLPGPKMIWQFGELGYDQELKEGSERTSPKPILWNYYQQPNRYKLFQTIAGLIKLRHENDLFRNPESVVSLRVGQSQYDRRINITGYYKSATIVGNFDVDFRSMSPKFQHTGEWYDYFSGDTMTVSDTEASITLAPGEFHIYTNMKLETPTSVEFASNESATTFSLEQNYPNPFNAETTILYSLLKSEYVTLKIFNMLGQEIKSLVQNRQSAGYHHVSWDGTDNYGHPVASGLYIYRLDAGNFIQAHKMMMMK